jgi:tellurite resistance protein TehA-like permease
VNIARRNVLACVACGGLFAALTFVIPKLSVLSNDRAVSTAQAAAFAFLMPGLTCAFAFSGNAHAFHLWIAALGNFVFYFASCWIAIRLVKTLRRRKRMVNWVSYRIKKSH